MKNKSKFNIKTLLIYAGSIFVVTLMTSIVISRDNPDKEIKDTRTALENWIENQRIISKEKRDFDLAKEMLNERIELVQTEIKTINKKISDTEESIAQADKKRAKMLEENEKLKQASETLSRVAQNLENKIKLLLPKLPAPIKDRIKPLTQRLPQKDKETKLSVAERFQNVVGILNEIDKFNREITVTSEVRTLEDGSSVEVTALYLGLGQGFYCSADGTVAGVGNITNKGWKWTQDNQAADQISAAVAILKNEKVAAFVNLPVEIK